jgi:long-chain-fatty-acid---luciferin-component ligase
VHVVVRDPRDLSPLPEGQVGLMTYLDPSASSYPCFLVGEDFCRIEVDRCPCGRYGTTVDVIRRIAASTHQGCALRVAAGTTLR